MATKWNQTQQGNAWVSDGSEGYWAEFPAGTTAQEVLDAYMSTADYSEATRPFVVRAEISGDVATVRVVPSSLVTSVYEQHGAWSCDDGDGNLISAGLPSREAAEKCAAAWVRRRTGEDG